MTTFINYTKMSPLQQHQFNKTGYADKEFVMSQDDFNMLLDEIVASQHKQAMQQEQQIEEDV